MRAERRARAGPSRSISPAGAPAADAAIEEIVVHESFTSRSPGTTRRSGGESNARCRTSTDAITNPSIRCADFNPDESAFTETGSASSHFFHAGAVTIGTSARVLATAAAVRADTNLVARSPHFLPCFEQVITRALEAQSPVTVSHFSSRKLALPPLGDSLIAYRATMTLTYKNGQSAPVLFDVVLLSRDRTEVALYAAAPLVAQIPAAMTLIDAKLTTRLAARAHP